MIRCGFSHAISHLPCEDGAVCGCCRHHAQAVNSISFTALQGQSLSLVAEFLPPAQEGLCVQLCCISFPDVNFTHAVVVNVLHAARFLTFRPIKARAFAFFGACRSGFPALYAQPLLIIAFQIAVERSDF